MHTRCRALKSFRRILMNFLTGGMVTSNKRLDFGGYPDREADPGIFKGTFAITGYRCSCTNFADKSKNVDGFLRNVFEKWGVSLATDRTRKCPNVQHGISSQSHRNSQETSCS